MRPQLIAAVLAATVSVPLSADAADYLCDGLVPANGHVICSAFEPNWLIDFTCSGTTKVNFVDAFSGQDLIETPGTAVFSSEDPWTFETSHGIKGTIASVPCTDESDTERPFTLTPAAVPGLSTFMPVCCRVE